MSDIAEILFWIAAVIVGIPAVLMLAIVFAVVVALIANVLIYTFTIEIGENGEIRECIGCPEAGERCNDCTIRKKAEKKIARMQEKERLRKMREAELIREDEEQIKFLQEYRSKKGKGRK